jgi:hypothetical protein
MVDIVEVNTNGVETENEIQYDDVKEFQETLTEWDNEPTIEALKADLTAAYSHHNDQVEKIDTWLDNLYVRGDAKPKKRNGRSAVQPQLIRKQAEWRYAALSEPFLAPTELFTASPVTWEDKKAAQQNQLVLNTQIRRDVDLVAFIDRYVRAAVDEGTAIVRTGWEFIEEEVEKEIVIYDYQVSADPADVAKMEQLAIQFSQNPQSIDNMPEHLAEALGRTISRPDLVQQGQVIIPVGVDTQTITEIETVVNRPTIEVCDHEDVIIDPSCKGDINKAKFIVYRFPTSLADLKKAGMYTNLDHIEVHNEAATDMPISGSEEKEEKRSFTFNDDPRKQMYAYEYWGYWDVEGDGVLQPIVATFIGNTIIRMNENPFPDKKIPFFTVPYLPVKDSVYGEPDGVLIEDNQKVVGAVTRGMIDIMARSAAGQKGMRKDALDPVNKRRYDRGDDYEFNPQVDPRQAMIDHVYPEIPQSALVMLNLQNQEAESLTGVKAFTGGLSGEALGQTATGIRGVLDAASKRELGILRRLAGGIVEIGRRFMSMNSEFLADTEIIRITNEEFVPVRRDDLDGKVDLRLTVTTAEEDAQKAQELAFMLQTTAQSMGPEFTKIILSDIARLRKMPELAKRIEQYEPQPDPIQQQIAQLEMMKLQAEIEKLRSEAAENYAEAQLDQAKAGEANSKRDLNDLEFIEKETGTSHARDVDKITSQAKAQADKSMLETLMKQRSGE